MYMLRRIRDRRLNPAVREQECFYAQARTPAQIRDWQLERLNQQWHHVRQTISYYRDQVNKGILPRQFQSLSQFSNVMPIMTRADIRANVANMTDPTLAVHFTRKTGGSTGEPVQMPGSNCELPISNTNAWHGRGWFGVQPSDKLFMIWGHSHLLGRGMRGWINGQKRQIKDRVLGYCRQSAYDLSEPSLRQAAEKILRQRPGWIYSYSVALDRFAEINRSRRDDFHSLKLKVAIATTESFPKPDSAARIADVLGCPAMMEYGSVETGVMAQQRLDGQYVYFWHAHLIEGIASEHVPGCHELLVTSLYPRVFPLMRYRIGDLISENPDAPGFQQRFTRVIGRCDDYVVLSDHTRIHCAALTAAVRESTDIGQYQVVQSSGGAITLRYVSGKPLGADGESEIRRKLSIIHPLLGSTRIERVSALEQAVSGKTRAVIRESPS